MGVLPPTPGVKFNKYGRGTRWKLGMRVFKKKQRSMRTQGKVAIFVDTTYTCMMMALRGTCISCTFYEPDTIEYTIIDPSNQEDINKTSVLYTLCSIGIQQQAFFGK